MKYDVNAKDGEMVFSAFLPTVNRGLLLHKMWTNTTDRPEVIKTEKITWDNMVVCMDYDSENNVIFGRVFVHPDKMNLKLYIARMASILDCCSKTTNTGNKTLVKFNVFVPRQKVANVQCNLFDAIVEADSTTGEMKGVMKIRHKSVKRGMAKLILLRSNNNYNLQVVVEHESPKGVKSLISSILSRVNPQYKGGKRQITEVQKAFREKKSAEREFEFSKRLLDEIIKKPGATAEEKRIATELFEEAEFRYEISSSNLNEKMGIQNEA